MKSRIRITERITLERAESILGEIATLTRERNQTRAALDHELDTARARYEGRISALASQIEDKAALLETFLALNPDVLPKNRKSIQLAHGTIGFRTGMHRLRLLVRGTWESVLETLAAKRRNEFIRTKREVAKDIIIAACLDGQLRPHDLEELGIQIVQEETFFIEPKLTPTPETAAMQQAA